MLAWHCDTLRAQHAAIRDALSGRALDVLRQCVAIEVEGSDSADEDVSGVKDAQGWPARCALCRSDPARRRGPERRRRRAAHGGPRRR